MTAIKSEYKPNMKRISSTIRALVTLTLETTGHWRLLPLATNNDRLAYFDSKGLECHFKRFT